LGNYSWKSGEWIHLRIEWDDRAPTSRQQRIFINGVEPTHSDDAARTDTSYWGTNEWYVYRAFVPFDTLGLPSNVNISAATLGVRHETVYGPGDNDNDGKDYVTVVQTKQADATTLRIGDYDE
jgi:hypothetical protein